MSWYHRQPLHLAQEVCCQVICPGIKTRNMTPGRNVFPDRVTGRFCSGAKMIRHNLPRHLANQFCNMSHVETKQTFELVAKRVFIKPQGGSFHSRYCGLSRYADDQTGTFSCVSDSQQGRELCRSRGQCRLNRPSYSLNGTDRWMWRLTHGWTEIMNGIIVL